MPELNETHDATLTSWVTSANAPDADFPVQNLPYGVFRRAGADEPFRVGVAIGDRILDVGAARGAGIIGDAADAAAAACEDTALNSLMAMGPDAWRALRSAISRVLRADTAEGRDAAARGEGMTIAIADAELTIPARIGDYTDFYASVHHATNVGGMFRPDNPLLPNYKWVPIGYHGRASSIVVSGARVRRPVGQTKGADQERPSVGPSRLLDYEMEVGAFIGTGNQPGEPIPIGEADRHLFGLCLVNDWSARDMQAWEYQPLGPFLAKNFLTTVSPWVVTMEALAPFRIPATPRPPGDPAPLPYLTDARDLASGGVAITLDVLLLTPEMRAAGLEPERLSRGSFSEMYWTLAQMLTHHASSGCNLRPGDLIASGTVSGPDPDSRGCLLELTRRGAEPVRLPNGETRGFLQDGDEVIMVGRCEREGARSIGFGECRGVVVGAG